MISIVTRKKVAKRSAKIRKKKKKITTVPMDFGGKKNVRRKNSK